MFQGLITGFREALEAFLLITVMHRYLKSIGANNLRHFINLGLVAGLTFSAILGYTLYAFKNYINTEKIGDLWEVAAGFIAITLITTFILWMIRHLKTMPAEIRNQIKKISSKWGIFAIALVITTREGVETTIFAFSSPEGQSFVFGNFAGIFIAATLAITIFYTLVKIPIQTIMKITLAYLVIQAGYILGYSLHELISYLKEEAILATNHPFLIKLFDASKVGNGILDHKTGAIGLPLNVLLGWYSRPEWIQFITQYLYTGLIFLYWNSGLKTTSTLK